MSKRMNSTESEFAKLPSILSHENGQHCLHDPTITPSLSNNKKLLVLGEMIQDVLDIIDDAELADGWDETSIEEKRNDARK
jgi:hypothetical protein